MAAKKKSREVTYQEVADAIEGFFDAVDYWSAPVELTICIDNVLGRKGTWTWPAGSDEEFLRGLKPLVDSASYTLESIDEGMWECSSYYAVLKLIGTK